MISFGSDEELDKSGIEIDTERFSEALDAQMQDSIECPLCNSPKVDWTEEKRKWMNTPELRFLP